MSGNSINEGFGAGGNPVVLKPLMPGSAVVVALSALIAFLALFVEWATDQLFDKSRNAWNVPMQFLWDETPASFDEFPVAWAILVAIVLMVVGAARSSLRGLSVVGSAFVVLWSAWYVRGVSSAVDYYEFEQGVGDLVGMGAWLCLVAGIVGLVTSIVYLRSVRPTPRSA